MATVKTGKVQRDGHLTGDNAVIVGGLVFLLEPAIGFAAHFARHVYRGGGVGDGRDFPFAPALALDGQSAGMGDGQVIDPGHGIRNGRGFGALATIGRGAGRQRRRRIGDVLTDGKLTLGAVQANLQAGAGWQVQRFVGDLVQVKRRLAGIGGRLCPGFPAWAARHGDGSAGAKAGDRGGLPERPEQHRHDKGGQRDIAQGKPVTGRQPQVGGHGLRKGGTGGHPVLMRLPKRGRGRIAGTKRQGIAQGGNRAAGHAAVQPVQRIADGRFAKPADAKDHQHQRGNRNGPACRLRPDQRAKVLQPEGQRGNHHKGQRPQGPEGARQTFRP